MAAYTILFTGPANVGRSIAPVINGNLTMSTHNNSIISVAAQVQVEMPIFVFASGHRCGSTLLQRLLNSNQNILIWGEQHGFLNGILSAYRDLQRWEAIHSNERHLYLVKGYNHFLANMMPAKHDLGDAMVAFLITLFALPASKLGKFHWGFKEVRYDATIAGFLQECFPNARFIHITRNIEDCYLSLKRWERDENERWEERWTIPSLNDWARINSSFLQQKHNLVNYLLVRYEDMIAEPKTFIDQLADFLKMETTGFDEEVFRKRIHSSGTGGQRERETLTLADLSAKERDILARPNYIEIAKRYGYELSRR